MKQIRMRIAALGLAAACWGIAFPEYTFTADSYAVICETEPDAADGDKAAANAGKNREYAQDVLENKAGRTCTPRDIQKAAKEGKVRYRFKILELLKKYVWGTAGSQY